MHKEVNAEEVLQGYGVSQAGEFGVHFGLPRHLFEASQQLRQLTTDRSVTVAMRPKGKAAARLTLDSHDF